MFREGNAEDAYPDMPEIGYGIFLVRFLWEFGPSDFDVKPVSFAEIEAWKRSTNRTLTTWEIVTLRKMSEAYCGFYHKGKSPSCIAPYKPAQVGKRALIRKILSLFRV